MLKTLGFAQLLIPLRAQEFTERIGRVHRAVNNDMSHMNSLGGVLSIQGLTQHTSPPHRGSMRMLAGIKVALRR